jgi:carbamate kinase
VVTLVTQTLCSANDTRTREPAKPIGHPLDELQLRRLAACGVPFGRDGAGRWRRMAPSPRPVAVVERGVVRALVEGGHVVITCGGGGPPVYDDPALLLEGIDAVVDKDRVAAILGRDLGADVLLILTDVDAVYRGWGTPEAQPIPRLTLREAERLLAERAAAEGSMRPKLEAALEFVRAGGSRAVIAELGRGLEALAGRTGTTVVGSTRRRAAAGFSAARRRYRK